MRFVLFVIRRTVSKKFRIRQHFFSFSQLVNFLMVYAEHGSNATKTNQILIANATKKSSDILVNTGLSLKQNRQSLSQLVGRGNRRIEVQRPLLEGIS